MLIEQITSTALGTLHPENSLISQLREIEEECFSHPLTEQQIEHLLRDENTLFLVAYEMPQTAHCPYLLGSVWAQTVLDEGYIGNVAVRGVYRRRGVADLLLRELEASARDRGLTFLTLEVRAGNTPAIALYEKNGYCNVGVRRAYYSDPREDAVLMTKFLKQEKT